MGTWAEDCAAAATELADEHGEAVTLRLNDASRTMLTLMAHVDRNPPRIDSGIGAVREFLTVRIPRSAVTALPDGSDVEVPITAGGTAKRCRIMRPAESHAWWVFEVVP